MTGVCAVCSSPATQRCAGCYSVAYCSPACQKQDWPLHKPACTKPYTVKESKVAGRFMVATRSLQPGDIVLRERAAVVGPSLEGSNPVLQPLVTRTALYRRSAWAARPRWPGPGTSAPPARPRSAARSVRNTPLTKKSAGTITNS